MFNRILSWFGLGHKETVDDSPPTTEKYYAGARRQLAANEKKYYRRNNKFYIRKHSGFDFDLDEEIIDLILLELLIMEYDLGNISSYEDIQENVETVDHILDVDISTIPVEDTLSMIDTPAQVEMVEAVVEPEPATSFHEELTTPQPEYVPPTHSAPEPAYMSAPTSEPEPTPVAASSYNSGGSSYSSGSSDYSSSSSDSSSSDSSSD